MNLLVIDDIIPQGLIRVFKACGQTVSHLNLSKDCVLDCFSKFHPDIVFSRTSSLNRAVLKGIKQNNCKVVLQGPCWGQAINDTSELEKKLIFELPNVYLYYETLSNRLNDFAEKWINNGVRCFTMMKAADIYTYSNGQRVNDLSGEMGYIGNYKNQKHERFKQFLFPIAHSSPFRFKVWSNNSKWPIAQNLGSVAEKDVAAVVASIAVWPQISSPKTIEYGINVSDRVFNVPLSSLLIHDNSSIVNEIYPNVPSFDTPEVMKELVRHFLESPQAREDARLKMFDIVIKNHTYFHRAARLFESLGYIQATDFVEKTYKGILGEKYER